MYTVSPEFDTAIHAPGRTLRSQLAIAGGATLDDSVIASIEVKRAVVPDSGLLLGTVIAQQATIVLLDPEAVYAPEDFTGAEFTLSIGVEVAGGGFEYVPLGIFTADQPKRSENILSILAYDRMVRAERPYVSALTYPSTVGAVLAEAASQSGLTLAAGAILNSGLAVPAAITGATCRQVIGWAAEVAAGFAQLNRAGKLEIVPLAAGSAVEALTPANYFPPMSVADAPWWADGVVVSATPEDAGITFGTATRPWPIIGNPFLVDNPVTEITAIVDALAGVELWPFAADWQGNPALDPGDVITVQDYKTGTVRNTLTGIETLRYNGGMRSTLALPAPSAQQQATDVRMSVDKRFTAETAHIKRLIAEVVEAVLLKADRAELEELVVGTAQIADLAVTAAKIANATITNAKIASLSADKINAGTLSADRIAAGAISADKLVSGTITAASGVIADAAITSAKIADLAVTAAKIANGTITTAKIGDAQITSAKIANASIANAHIANLSADKINAGQLTLGSSLGTSLILKNSLNTNIFELSEGGVRMHNNFPFTFLRSFLSGGSTYYHQMEIIPSMAGDPGADLSIRFEFEPHNLVDPNNPPYIRFLSPFGSNDIYIGCRGLLQMSNNTKFNGAIYLDNNNSNFKSFYFQTNGLNRWHLYTNSDEETGSNDGSTLTLRRFNDAGTFISNILTVSRRYGIVNFNYTPQVAGSAVIHNGTYKNYIKAGQATSSSSAGFLTTVTFDEAFPTGYTVFVTVVPRAASASVTAVLNTTGTSITGFSFRCSAASTVCEWIAVGIPPTSVG